MSHPDTWKGNNELKCHSSVQFSDDWGLEEIQPCPISPVSHNALSPHRQNQLGYGFSIKSYEGVPKSEAFKRFCCFSKVLIFIHIFLLSLFKESTRKDRKYVHKIKKPQSSEQNGFHKPNDVFRLTARSVDLEHFPWDLVNSYIKGFFQRIPKFIFALIFNWFLCPADPTLLL